MIIAASEANKQPMGRSKGAEMARVLSELLQGPKLRTLLRRLRASH